MLVWILFYSTYTNSDLSLRWELSRKAWQIPWKRMKKKERYKWHEWGDSMEHKIFNLFSDWSSTKEETLLAISEGWQYIQFCSFCVTKTLQVRNMFSSIKLQNMDSFLKIASFPIFVALQDKSSPDVDFFFVFQLKNLEAVSNTESKNYSLMSNTTNILQIESAL